MDHRIEDKLQTMMAMTHTIQTRIIQSCCRGRMSEEVADQVMALAKSLREDAYKVGQLSKEVRDEPKQL